MHFRPFLHESLKKNSRLLSEARDPAGASRPARIFARNFHRGLSGIGGLTVIAPLGLSGLNGLNGLNGLIQLVIGVNVR